MRNMILAGAMMFALCANAVAEEDVKGKGASTAGKTVIFEEAGGEGPRTIDAGGPARNKYPDDGGVDDAGTMPPYESYDENTGLPDRVPSDTAGQFD
jgi:hypothetical protein